MDFSKLGSTKKSAAPTDPVKIFESLPSLSGTYNDLWRGQAKALTEWHASRQNRDVLVSLNTGAGKTVVGLLIAQSLVNEGRPNVLYVCSTIDLVEQTAAEASRIGVEHTTRVRSGFSNDLFETGKAFCITTYAALFNGLSALRRRNFPSAIIFDDAHVAEGLLRDSFSLKLDIRHDPNVFGEIADLFKPHFKKLGILGRYRDALDVSQHASVLVAPSGLYDRQERLLDILLRHGLKEHETQKYPFAWLEDHLHACAIVFTRGAVEIAPPFIPSLALDIFGSTVQRVYLSATLESQTEFIRAFGRKPDCVITPSNDAGNGERLIVSGTKVKGGFGPDFAVGLSGRRKVLVAVPDYERAKAWLSFAPAPSVEDFSQRLQQFRQARSGGFTLVSRVDGIDLPHDTCRIMLIEGIPAGSSLLIRYQWEYLRMNNVYAARVANRLAQLFGRINRGRNDYGAFLIEGAELNNWLANDRNLALLPPLLQKQILIGREVQTSFDVTEQAEVVELVDRVLSRDDGWLSYYQREVKLAELDKDQLARHEAADPFLVNAAISEAKYAAAMWNDDPATARRALEKTIDDTAQHDTPLGGWHAVWLGASLDRQGDVKAAQAMYSVAVRRLGNGITLPRPAGGEISRESAPPLNAYGHALSDLLGHVQGGKFERELNKLTHLLSLIDQGDPRQAEAGMRALGELLGLSATRPDNDEGTGPDVLWRDDQAKLLVGFELKTDKNSPATYFKKDINQGHDHIEYMTSAFPEHQNLGLIFVGPSGVVHSQANPSKEMHLCTTSSVTGLRDDVLSLIEDLRRKTPIERPNAILVESMHERWGLPSIISRLRPMSLKR